MRKKLIWLIVFFCLLLNGAIAAQVTWISVILHAHTTESDCTITEKQILEWCVLTGNQLIIFNNHLPCITGRCKADHEHRKDDYANEYFKDVDYVYKGIVNYSHQCEVFVSGDEHYNLFFSADMVDDEFKTLDWRDPQEIVDIMHNKAKKLNQDCLITLNHPAWVKKGLIVPDRIDAIEFFNIGGTTLDGLFNDGSYASIWALTDTTIDVYFLALKKYLESHDPDDLPAVIGGSDCHRVYGELNCGRTFYYGHERNRVGFMQAVDEGKTFASLYDDGATYSRIIDLNYLPQKTPYQVVGEVHLTGLFDLKFLDLKGDTLLIYRDGDREHPVFKKTYFPSLAVKHQFDFIDKPEPGIHTYNLYWRGRLFTSAIVFDVQKANQEQPSVTESKPQIPFDIIQIAKAESQPQTVINTMPVISPDGRKIAFVSNRNGNAEIYTMNSNGTNQERITYNLASDICPAWTNDGNLLFESDRSGIRAVWYHNLQTGQEINMTAGFKAPCYGPLNNNGEIRYWFNGIVYQFNIISDRGISASQRYNNRLTSGAPASGFNIPWKLPSDLSQAMNLYVSNNQMSNYNSDRTDVQLMGLPFAVKNVSFNQSISQNDPTFFVGKLNSTINTEIYETNQNGSYWKQVLAFPGDKYFVSAVRQNNNIFLVFDNKDSSGYIDIYIARYGNNAPTRLTYGNDTQRINQFWQEEDDRQKKIQEEQQQRKQDQQNQENFNRVMNEVLNRIKIKF